MNIKLFILTYLSLFLIQGCTTLDEQLLNKAGESADSSSYLTDIDVQTPEKTENIDPILKSTHDILESTSVSQNNINENIDEYLDKNAVQSKGQSAPIKPQYEDVWLRLPELYQLSDIDNKRIQQQQKWFLKHKNHIEDVSELASPFLYFIIEEVNRRNMPGEIALLPIIESGFKTHAYSRMKASGLWQFMPSTGRYFGLKQNWWYDGRRDVYHSTMAALTYLQQLNKYYKGDWLLALAAYNAGSGNVNKAIKKNLKKGKPIDYWSLPLPKETFKYIPKLLAVSKIIQDHKKYNISLHPIENSPRLMLVDTKSQIDLSVVAKMVGISLKEMQTYNPAFNQWATDPEGPHHLLIPIDKVERYKLKLASLEDKDRVQWHRHKIRSGESLSVIARKYNISVSVLKTSNHLKNNRIRAGKHLMVPSSGQNIAYRPSEKSTTIAASKDLPIGSLIYHVRKGDSFWTIARRFNMSHKKLASLNGLSSGDTLSIGQKLVISKSISVARSNKSDSNKNIINYKVKSGDSLYTISKQFKVTVNDLKRWNRLSLKKYLKPGQELKVLIISSAQPI